MTERLYFDSDELEAQSSVVQCSAADDGLYQVILSRTLFHPQGGGQPADTGTIGAACVVRVLNDGDNIVHLTDQPLEPGEATIKVDGAARLLHTRLHSAGHVIGLLGEKFGWSAVKGHHWPGEARVVFDAREQAVIPDASQLEHAFTELAMADLPRQLAIDATGRQVAFGHLPGCYCGGTHVSSLGQIGSISISKVKEKKGQLSVYYDVSQ